MILALTGTPGTGKTTIAQMLCNTHQMTYINLHQFAQTHHLINGVDEQRVSDIIDMDILSEKILNHISSSSSVILDGHLSHFIPDLDWVIVLRCHPNILKERLEKKHWSEKKVYENLQAEILDIILSEAVDLHNVDKVFEIDTSETTIKDTAKLIDSMIKNKFKGFDCYKPGNVDWTALLMSDNDLLEEK